MSHSTNGHTFTHNAYFKPTRGVIVLDTGVLFGLWPTVQKNGVERYIDVLSFLAKQGYGIVVPEMVALEAGDAVCGTRDYRAYVRHRRHKHSPQKTEFLNTWLRDVMLHPEDHPNTMVMEQHNPRQGEDGHVFQYLKEVHKILNASKAQPGEEYRDIKTQEHLMDHQKEEHHHYGDLAIWRTLVDANHAPELKNLPLYMISEDLSFMRDMTRQPKLKMPELRFLTTCGLMHAIVANHINRHIAGLEHFTDAYPMNARRRDSTDAPGVSAAVDCTLAAASGPGWHDVCHDMYSPGPMSQAMKELAQILPPPPAVATARSAPEAGRPKSFAQQAPQPRGFLRIDPHAFDGLTITDDQGREV